MSRRWMITATQLSERLAAPGPQRPLVLDARWNLSGPDGEQEFRAGHVPGARWVDLETELSAHGDRSRGGSGRHPLPRPDAFQTAMAGHGLTGARSVVAMDGGQLLGAARLWWLLRDTGHEQVRVLDGGFAAWRAAGLTVQTGPQVDVEPGDFTAGRPRLPVLDAAGAAAASRAGRPLVDVRAAARYRGEQEPVDPVAGHVPGATNRPGGDLFAPDGTLRPTAELLRAWSDLGPRPVFYCGSGVTATQSLLALAETGREDGELYAGSWSDWVSDPDRPVATGADPGSITPGDHRT